jgi:hypothetical protein
MPFPVFSFFSYYRMRLNNFSRAIKLFVIPPQITNNTFRQPGFGVIFLCRVTNDLSLRPAASRLRS